MVKPAPPPPPLSSAEMQAARALHARYCRPDAVAIADPKTLVERITFAAEPGAPAELILCLDSEDVAVGVQITTIQAALVFLSYRPFAPFWPAAEARWGEGLSRLREEIRRAPTDADVRAYPYFAMVEQRVARAVVESRIAGTVGDHDRGIAMLQGEIDFIAQYQIKRPKSSRYGFALSLLLGRFANALSKRDGPAAAADRMKALLAQYTIPPEYRANVLINYAAVLAEAGRGAEALAVIEPVYAAYRPDPSDRRVYEIPGSVREYSWIIACSHHLNGTPKKAASYMAVVNTYDEQPVDPYVTWTKGSTEIRLRMYKCMGDTAGFLAAFKASAPPLLSHLWLEFQPYGVAVIGMRKFSALMADPEGAALAASYRELPEAYHPALEGWRQLAPAE
jgi:hypothetical protein